jgi:chemotaxis protein CheD
MSPSIEEQVATSFYYDRLFDVEAAKIMPGQFFFTCNDMLIVTVLGSCVAACVRDRISGIGGMNHFMLPDSGNDARSPISASMRYGTYAMEVLINELLKAGAKRENLEAKVFGGANVLQGFSGVSIGERNAEFVRDFLKAEGIQLTAEDMNDIHPRKVYFFPRTGQVLVRKFKRMNNNTLVSREKDYEDRLLAHPIGGAVELFPPDEADGTSPERPR